MSHEKFRVADIERLNDESRFETTPPDVLWQALGDPVPGTIVDIGAGTGLFSCRFAEMAPGSEVYAVDLEPVMVDWMLEHRATQCGGRLHPLLGDEAHVPLPDGVADLVVMMNLHHELVEPVANYREAFRLLAAGGWILVVDWLPGGAEAGPPQHIRVSPEGIGAALSEAGFDSVVAHPGLRLHSLITALRP
ncbi:MAG: class I SAM-dependent methyltransferase [Coriobacteriia bacterium]|nr:class I SAM-dependent methyltransferase [Coriobacteriia bacterium]